MCCFPYCEESEWDKRRLLEIPFVIQRRHHGRGQRVQERYNFRHHLSRLRKALNGISQHCMGPGDSTEELHVLELHQQPIVSQC